VSGPDTLAKLARLVAIEAPERRGDGTARIPWELVNRIRACLEAEGFDWRWAVRQRLLLEEIGDRQRGIERLRRQRESEETIAAAEARLERARAAIAKHMKDGAGQ
jgi:hypothetical protein